MITVISKINSDIKALYPKKQKNNAGIRSCAFAQNNTLLAYPKNYYNVSFRGMSTPEDYDKTSEYFSSLILKSMLQSNASKSNNNIPQGITASDLSKSKINDAIDTFFDNDFVYSSYKLADKDKIKWGDYVAEDVRFDETERVNQARIHRLKKWQEILTNPETSDKINFNEYKQHQNIFKEIFDDNCLKFIIWKAVTSGIEENNRHIPPPFSPEALAGTISWLNSIQSINRKYQINSETEFLNLYASKLKENLLNQIKSRPFDKTKPSIAKEFSDGSCWIKIPKFDKKEKNYDNLYAVEIFSHENWCTRSGIDKAKAALEDGNFYVYVRPGKDNILESVIGMASFNGKIIQIQGPKNDNLIPLDQLKNVKDFISQSDLKYSLNIEDEGPRAGIQILMAEKLASKIPDSDMTFEKAISDKKTTTLLKAFGYNYTTVFPQEISQELLEQIFEGKLSPKYIINGSYLPKINLGKRDNHIIPYSFLEIDEDSLLENVCEIKGDLVLTKIKNPIIKSSIKVFPKNLEKVDGNIYCSREQFKKFEKDMLRVVNNDSKRIIVF